MTESLQLSDHCPERRYRLRIDSASPGPASVEVFDLSAQRRLALWQGALADRLLATEAFPPSYRNDGSHLCDKGIVRRLTLAAAASQLALQHNSGCVVEFSRHRLRSHTPPRSSLHHRILRLLYAHPGYHFSEHDVVCLILLGTPGVDDRQIVAHLGDIVRWRLAQRIEVDAVNVFYDINTTPHLHVYDAHRRILLDAPKTGYVHI